MLGLMDRVVEDECNVRGGGREYDNRLENLATRSIEKADLLSTWVKSPI